MKKSLGKILTVILFFTATLYAKELATYTLKANKSEAYIKEAVEITFVATQKDHTNVMFFFLQPKPSTDYEIKLLNKKTTELSYHNFTTTFTYILFPLKEKNLMIDFDFTIKEASDDAVAQVYTGSRDNVKWIETEDTVMQIKPLHVTAKKLERDVDLVGDFTLASKINKTHIDQYDSINALYTLHGTGYKEKNITLVKNMKGVTMFSEVNDGYLKLTSNGYTIQRDIIYALSAKNSFIIPKVELQAYSPKLKRYYTLTTPSYSIQVDKIDTKTLLDDTDSPMTKPLIPFEQLQQWGKYIIIFLFGYISALLVPKTFSRSSKDNKFSDIKEAKNVRELVMVLTSKYPQFREEILSLEELAYQKNSSANLKKIKSKILNQLKH